MTATVRWSLLVAGEAALVLFLLTWGNTFTGSIPLHRMQLIILAVLGGIGWLAILTRPSRLPTLLIVAPLPLLAALTFTSVWSAYPSLSWFATWQCAAYIGIAWLLAMQASHPTGRRNLVAAIGIVATIVTAAYLLEVAFAWAEWFGLGFPVTSLPLRPLGDGGLIQIPTWLGDVIALSAPVAVVSMWTGNARVAGATLAVAASLAIVLSGTRSVLLLIIVLAVFTAALLIRRRASRRVAVVATIGAAAVAVLGLGVILLAGRSFDEGRSSAYASAIERFGMSPLAGTGPGTYGVLRMSDAVDGLSRLAFPDAHNVILTTAAESGIVGLAGLALAMAGYAVAIRRRSVDRGGDRPVVGAALFGIAVVAGHAMVEVVFALIGIVLLVIACLSIAASGWTASGPAKARRSRRLDAVLVTGLAVVVASSAITIRNEGALEAVAESDRSLPASPSIALGAARRATDASPDSASAWWVRMVAADLAGDAADALASARRTVDLEGFGQEWLALAILEARSGDRTAARLAIDRATAHPPLDPVVELNASIIYDETGAPDPAHAAARRLLSVQPDIEPVLASGPARLRALIARARPVAAMESKAAGDLDSAFLIALSGEDHDLARSLLEAVGAADPTSRAYWQTVTDGWFGDAASRTAHDTSVTADPSPSALMWSWRLAARACDSSRTDHWERALEIGAGRHPVTPTTLGVAPGFQVRLLPSRYPGVVWRMDHPDRPYIEGIWTYELGRPACSM